MGEINSSHSFIDYVLAQRERLRSLTEPLGKIVLALVLRGSHYTHETTRPVRVPDESTFSDAVRVDHVSVWTYDTDIPALWIHTGEQQVSRL